MAASLYDEGDLVSIYDLVNPLGAEADFFAALASERPKKILDVGCGTGRLASRLAADGHEVTGVEPSPLMLQCARSCPDSDLVTWVCSGAAPLSLAARFDLIIMVGHVFQVFLCDDDARDALATLAAHLAPHGQIAFATRNPAAREWEQWTESQSRETYESPMLGTCTVHWQIDAVDGPLITYSTYLHLLDGTTRRGEDTICFRGQAAVQRLLDKSGLAPETWHGNWNGAPPGTRQPEIIVIAGKARRSSVQAN
jgi:SAM-dependent methyltransferase